MIRKSNTRLLAVVRLLSDNNFAYFQLLSAEKTIKKKKSRILIMPSITY